MFGQMFLCTFIAGSSTLHVQMYRFWPAFIKILYISCDSTCTQLTCTCVDSPSLALTHSLTHHILTHTHTHTHTRSFSYLYFIPYLFLCLPVLIFVRGPAPFSGGGSHGKLSQQCSKLVTHPGQIMLQCNIS